MDDEERARREEIDRKEKALYEKIDEVANSIRKKLSAEVAELYKRVEAVETGLQNRNREIENESRDRDTKHDVEIATLKTKLEDLTKQIDKHMTDAMVHKKPVGTATLMGLKGMSPDQMRADLQRQLHQSQPMPSGPYPPVPQPQPPQGGDEYTSMGVPWYANPKWIGGVLLAIAAGITAIIIALGYARKDDAEKKPDKPEKPAVEATE